MACYPQADGAFTGFICSPLPADYMPQPIDKVTADKIEAEIDQAVDAAKPLSAEEKLAKVIEAQVKGQYRRWVEMDKDTYVLSDGSIEAKTESRPMIGHILEILLDPHGLRAAYAREHLADGMTIYYGLQYSHQILDAWISGGAEAAINTAFALLPKP